MVPFPSPEYDVDFVDMKKRHKKALANEYLRKHPDGNGLLLPPMKDEIKKDIGAWADIFAPTHDIVKVTGKGGWKDAIAHGTTEYWLKVMLAAAGVPRQKVGWLGSIMNEPGIDTTKPKFRHKTMEDHLFKGDLSGSIQSMEKILKKEKVPENLRVKMAAAWPDMVRAGVALSNIAERALEQGYGKIIYEKHKGMNPTNKPTEIDAFLEMLDSKIPAPAQNHRQICKGRRA